MKTSLFAVSLTKSLIIICLLGLGFSFSLAVQASTLRLGYAIISGISFVGLLIYLIASLIVGFVSWRKESRWWFVPFLGAAIFILSAPLDLRAGIAITDWNFRAHLQEYIKTVDDIKSGSVPSSTTFGPVSPSVLPSNVKAVLAVHYADGATVVLFLVGSGFPLHHTGYLFNGSDGNINSKAQFMAFEDRYYLRHETGNWYRFSD
jgi:hypothetical protein